MFDEQNSCDNVREGFNDDHSKFFFKDLVFDVEISPRRKRLGIVFNRQECRFTLKIGALMFYNCDEKELMTVVMRMLNNNLENFQQLLRDNVHFKDIYKQPSSNQYAQNDIIYLHGLPYRIEIEYEMRQGLFASGKKSQDSIEIVRQPQQLALLMVPQGTSHYAGKFERLYEEDYYRTELLNELPVVVTQAAADKHNELRPKYLKAIEDQLQKAMEQVNFSSSSVKGGMDNTTDDDNLDYDLSKCKPKDREALKEVCRLRSIKSDLLLNVPLQPGLVLPPRQQEYLESLYLKRALLEFSWIFTPQQNSLEFDTLQRHYGACVKYFTSKLQVDLWDALLQGKICSNHFLLSADNTFLERFIGIATPFKSFNSWFTERWVSLGCLFAKMAGSRFYDRGSLWSKHYQSVNLKFESELPLNYSINDMMHDPLCGCNFHRYASSSVEVASMGVDAMGDASPAAVGGGSNLRPDAWQHINQDPDDIEYEIEDYDDDFYADDDDSQELGENVHTEDDHDSSMPRTGEPEGVFENDYDGLRMRSLQKEAALITKKAVQAYANEAVSDEAASNDAERDLANISKQHKPHESGSGTDDEAFLSTKAEAEAKRELMLDWYEACLYKIEFTDDELRMNMALYPLLKVEQEDLLSQSMVLADQLDQPDLYLTPDIIGSQHWEVTGPLLKRLYRNKMQNHALAFGYLAEKDMIDELKQPSVESFAPQNNVSDEIEYSFQEDWYFGQPSEGYISSLGILKNDQTTDNGLSSLANYVREVALSKSESYSNIYWWPCGNQDIVQTSSSCASYCRFSYPLFFYRYRDVCAYCYNPVTYGYSISDEVSKLTSYLHLGELYFERTASAKVGKLKQQNYQAAQSKAWQSQGQDDKRLEAPIEQEQGSKQFAGQFNNQAGGNFDLPVLSFTGYAKAPTANHAVQAVSTDAISVDAASKTDQVLQQQVEALRMGKAGTQYSLCVELDHPIDDNYIDLLYKKYGQQAPIYMVNWDDASEHNQSAPKLHQKVRSSLLLPGMCWTLGAAGEEIDPAEALVACQDIYLPAEQEIDINRYEELTGKPLESAMQDNRAKRFGKTVAMLIQESNVFPHSCWRPKHWHRTLVRPGVIKLKIAFRKFGTLDSLKERQYRYDLLMSLCRRSLIYKVLEMVKLFCPVDLQRENGNVPHDITVLELKQISGLEFQQRTKNELQRMLYFILKGLCFRRIVILGGMSAQGRCTRKRERDPNWFYVDDIIQVLSISQELSAFPLTFVLATVAHESCHLDIFNHSAQFKRKLHNFCPFYNEVDGKWLELKFMQSQSPKRIRHGKLNVITVGLDKEVPQGK